MVWRCSELCVGRRILCAIKTGLFWCLQLGHSSPDQATGRWVCSGERAGFSRSGSRRARRTEQHVQGKLLACDGHGQQPPFDNAATGRRFPHVTFPLPRVAIAAALALSIGLHWGFLQSVAWVGMVVSYSHDGGIGEALEKTFDGKHPCCLCKAIAEGKKSEKRPESEPVAKKFEFSYSRTVFVFSPPTHFWEVGGLEERADSAGDPPPSPPPKPSAG
jgi:hypothetical protein